MGYFFRDANQIKDDLLLISSNIHLKELEIHLLNLFSTKEQFMKDVMRGSALNIRETNAYEELTKNEENLRSLYMEVDNELHDGEIDDYGYAEYLGQVGECWYGMIEHVDNILNMIEKNHRKYKKISEILSEKFIKEKIYNSKEWNNSWDKLYTNGVTFVEFLCFFNKCLPKIKSKEEARDSLFNIDLVVDTALDKSKTCYEIEFPAEVLNAISILDNKTKETDFPF